MKAPRVPDEEHERVAALQALNLLDTLPEERFDRLTRLARTFFSVQTVLVTLVDVERQWFKSRQGLDVRETDRTISFCGHAILEDGIFEIHDASKDDRFFDNPMVTGPPHVRFYAGVPLLSTDGFRVGTFCLIDSTPRQLTHQERQSLLDFAASVEAEINAFREHKLKATLAENEARNQAIARAQSYFIRGMEKPRAFESLLRDILQLTDSEYGLISEVKEDPSGDFDFRPARRPARGRYNAGFKTLASLAPHEAMLSGLMSLLPEVANSDEVAMVGEAFQPLKAHSANAANLAAYLGAPVFYNGRLVAVLIIANRPEAYDRKTIEFLQPLLATIGQLVSTLRNQKDIERKQRQIERLSRVAKDTTNSVVITDTKGRVEWVNESFTRITGYSLDDVLGRTPGEILQGKDTDPEAVVQMHRAIQSRQPFNIDVLNYTKSGNRFWMHVSCDTLLGPSGKHEGFIAIESDITQQKESEEKIRELLERLEKLTSNLPGMIYQFQLWPDGRSRIPYASEGLTSVYGVAASEVSRDASLILDMIHPEDRPRVLDSIQRSAETLSLWNERFRLIHPQGNNIWIEGRATPERVNDGSTLWHGFLADITDRKSLEQAQQDQAMHTQAILDNIVDGIVTIDAAGVISSVNYAVESMFSYSSDELLGKDIKYILPNIHREFHGKLLWDNIDAEHSQKIGASREAEAVRKSGEVFPVDLAFSKIFREGEAVFIGVIRDISERKSAEKQINNLAFYDSLTQIPNRRLFYDRLKHARHASMRSKSYCALLFIDLDNFKRLNDTAGHNMGDRLLKNVANRLTGCVRNNDTVARLGGDEFMILLESLGEDLKFAAARVEGVGDKIRRSLSQPYPDIHQKYRGSSSIGATLFCGDEESVEELLKQVDIAMYQAKAEGKGRLAFFDSYMQRAAMDYATLENELRSAIQEQQFELFYQVQVDVNGRATGAEALLRWRHPVRGWVRPGDFIPLAEETRLILPIGAWVLQAACEQLAAWATRPETEHLTVAVNVSALQMSEPDFVEKVLAAIDHAGANPHRLKLELTETLLASDIEAVIAKMTALRAKGISFSLDDFGTGYSSLAYLKRMPIEQLKIDQSFIRDIHFDRNDKIIAKSIIALAESMELAVIAEGVETEEHRKILLDQGCFAYQGYLYGRPMPVGEFEQSLAAR